MLDLIKQPHTRGIINFNNNCYMNSIFQCLSHSHIFLKYLLSNEFDEDIREDIQGYSIAIEIRKLLSLLWIYTSSSSSISIEEFSKQLQQYLIKYQPNTGIHIGNHNDANEFLQLFLNILDKYLGFIPNISINIKSQDLSPFDKISLKACNTWMEHYKENYSQIIDLFNGQFASEIHNNDEISHTFEPFQNLLLEIPEKEHNKSSDNEAFLTIENCLDKFMSREKINNKIEKSFYIWKPPKILIITLKRFNYLNQKNEKKIIYQSTLDISKYCRGNKRENIIYNLFGICCHQGTLDYGHYYSLCRKVKSSNWYKYDDSSVSKITEDNIIPLTSSAYILFYELE